MIMDENESCWNLNDVAIGLAEMNEEHGANHDAATVSSLGRQVMLSSSSPICISDPVTSHIKAYSFYEIDQTKLPVDAPLHLKSIRIVMVTEKSNTRVAVRYPSVNSLRLHLSEEQGVKRVPSLDEKYFMEPEVAGKVLYRRVSGDEIGENNNLSSFWIVACDEKNKGVCWSELLESREMVKWGKRKKVYYLKSEGASIRYDGGYEEEVEALNGGESKRKLHDVNELSNESKKKKKVVKNSNSRWPKQRYKLAEINMLKILKKKNAVCGNPIMRPELRAEARKLIGDTGLLDHLLKHMAGKVAPGGQDRFRRRHNADGAMEYWLESAELINIRKQAGVQDPYWTPPPGWKPGDNPAQDPVCAREFKQLKEDMAKLRLEIHDLLSKRQVDTLAVVTTPSLNIDLDGFLLRSKEMYYNLMNKKAKIEDEMLEISHSLRRLEEEMEKGKSAVEEEQNKPVESALTSDEKPGCMVKITTVPTETTDVTPEDRASKIKRLKSGFRICKPQGSFLWPNMTMSSPQPNKTMVQLEDIFLVSTPPSVSSSTASSSPHHLLSPLGPLPNCPVKPLPERRPVTVTLTAAATRPTHPLIPPETTTPFETITTSTAITTTATSTRTSIIDLNEMPCPPHTYPRRNQNWTTTYTIPCLGAAEKDDKTRQREEDERNETPNKECDQKQNGSSSSSVSSSSSSACLSRVSGT